MFPSHSVAERGGQLPTSVQGCRGGRPGRDRVDPGFEVELYRWPSAGIECDGIHVRMRVPVIRMIFPRWIWLMGAFRMILANDQRRNGVLPPRAEAPRIPGTVPVRTPVTGRRDGSGRPGPAERPQRPFPGRAAGPCATHQLPPQANPIDRALLPRRSRSQRPPGGVERHA